MSDARDIQHGVNDPVTGVDMKRKFQDNKTPHERAQRAADVRADASPAPDEELAAARDEAPPAEACDVGPAACAVGLPAAAAGRAELVPAGFEANNDSMSDCDSD